MRTQEPIFTKTDAGHARSVYVVRVGKRKVGFAWSVRKHRYRGTEGWNRGLITRNFHPIRWGSSKNADDIGDYRKSFYYSREQAAKNMMVPK